MKFLQAQEYQPRLVELFDRLSLELRGLLPDARIEHIGASSVPGAISKGDLDIFVGVQRGDFEEAIRRMNRLGYVQKTDTLQTSSLRMLVCDRFEVDVAVQLVEDDSEFEMFLKFRDFLLKDEDLLNKYNAMKLCCVGFDPDSYRRKKSRFIACVLNRGLYQ